MLVGSWVEIISMPDAIFKRKFQLYDSVNDVHKSNKVAQAILFHPFVIPNLDSNSSPYPNSKLDLRSSNAFKIDFQIHDIPSLLIA